MKIETINWCLIDDEKLLEKYKAICTKIEDLKKYWIKWFTSLMKNPEILKFVPDQKIKNV